MAVTRKPSRAGVRSGRSAATGSTASSPESHARHTPGPWTVKEASGNTVAEPNCELFNDWPELDPTVRHIGLAEVQANARLIAAAPDLLAALKDCRKAVAAATRVIADLDMAHLVGLDTETRAQRFIDECHACGLVDGFGQCADAAIAKAEGR